MKDFKKWEANIEVIAFITGEVKTYDCLLAKENRGIGHCTNCPHFMGTACYPNYPEKGNKNACCHLLLQQNVQV